MCVEMTGLENERSFGEQRAALAVLLSRSSTYWSRKYRLGQPGATPHIFPRPVGTASQGSSTKALRNIFVLTVLNASLPVSLTLCDN